MSEERNVVRYAPPASAERSPRVGYVYLLLGLQLLWSWPAAFAWMAVTCEYALVQNLAANLACATVVVAPSLAAVALAAFVVRRDPRPNPREYVALLIPGALALVIVVGTYYSTVSEWLHPGPFPPCP